MKRKKRYQEEHKDETWLLPYSDMLTLLVALFIVMFAMSQIDNQKLSAISQQFNVIFSGGTSMLIDSDGSNTNIIQSNRDPGIQNIPEQEMMEEVKNSLDQEIKSRGYSDKVKLILSADGLNISIQDTILFSSGEADILTGAEPILIQISNMLKGLGNKIQVSGYTDNVPINTSMFRSNWDLSYMRASNVMHFMIDTGHLAPERFSITAYGQYRPKYDNSTEEGRSKNRSVDILIVRN